MNFLTDVKRDKHQPASTVEIYNLNLQYQYWLYQKRITPSEIKKIKNQIENFSFKPKIGIIMPVYNVEESILEKAIKSVIDQTYTNWELCIADDASTLSHVKNVLKKFKDQDHRIKIKFLEKNYGIAEASNHALSLCTSDYVGFLDNDDELYFTCLYEIVKLLNKDKDFELIYTDEDKIDYDGRRIEPDFKPDWSLDLLLSFQYVNHFIVYKKQVVDEIGGFRLGFDGSQDYDLLLRAIEKTQKIGHIPIPLYGWRKIIGSTSVNPLAKSSAHEAARKAIQDFMNRRNIKSSVIMLDLPGLFRVKYELKDSKVSIIIISHDNSKVLRKCIQSIESKTTYKNYEILVVDHRSEKKETHDFLKTLKHKVIKYNEEFNYSKILNFAVKFADGEHFIFLNDDIEVSNAEWLSALLEHSQRDEIGVVGNLLIYPPEREDNLSGLIQHAGLVLGSKSAAGHVFYKHSPNVDSYRNLHRVIHNVSAVTGACMMVKRKIFEELNGFDETLKISHSDIDFCLRVRDAGYYITYTPFSQLYHFEGSTRGHIEVTEDEQKFINKWKDKFNSWDPFYNPNFSLVNEDYTISTFPNRNPALSALMEVFYNRVDLQKIFPEADQGDYSHLIEWAIKHGSYEHPPLRPYLLWYEKHLEPIKDQTW